MLMLLLIMPLPFSLRLTLINGSLAGKTIIPLMKKTSMPAGFAFMRDRKSFL